jgi:hypothetical protein
MNSKRGDHLSMNTRITEEKILRKMIILSGNSKINKNTIAQNTAETNFMSSLIREIKPNSIEIPEKVNQILEAIKNRIFKRFISILNIQVTHIKIKNI